MEWLGRAAQEYIQNLPSSQEQISRRREIALVTLFSLVAIAALLIFGTLQLVSGDVLAGALELIFASIASLNVAHAMRTGRVAVSQFVMTALLGALMVLLLFTGGVGGTGIFWFSTFPAVAFLINGRRKGALWMAVFVAAIVGLVFLSSISPDGIRLRYTPIQVRQAMSMVVALAVMIYMFVRQLEMSEETLGASIEDLESTNSVLSLTQQEMESEIEQRRQLELQSKEYAAELEQMNNVLLGREEKMIELKQRIKELEKKKKDT